MHTNKIVPYLLIGLFFFLSRVDVQAHSWLQPTPGTPTLQVATGITAYYDETVTVPIAFISNGSALTAAHFVIAFDKNCLRYESAEFLPGITSEFTPVIDALAAETMGEVDFSLSAITTTLTVPDLDPIAQLSFTTTCEPAANSVITATVGFNEQLTSFSDANGSVLGTLVGDVLTILGSIDTPTVTPTAT